jgi:hypothetical protein
MSGLVLSATDYLINIAVDVVIMHARVVLHLVVVTLEIQVARGCVQVLVSLLSRSEVSENGTHRRSHLRRHRIARR